MFKSKPPTGPMKTQPFRQEAMSSALPMMPTFGERAKIANRGPGMDAARAIKAKISRHKSLQKQRDSQSAAL
jgi:hypothetical protein